MSFCKFENNNIINIIISLIFLFFSFRPTLMGNVDLSLSSGKIKTLEEKGVKNIETIKKISTDENIMSTALMCDFFSNIISGIFSAVFFYNEYKK